jgi:hypothetical protein
LHCRRRLLNWRLNTRAPLTGGLPCPINLHPRYPYRPDGRALCVLLLGRRCHRSLLTTSSRRNAIKNSKSSPSPSRSAACGLAFFKKWAKRIGVKLRFGAIGKHGSIAVVERFIRTMKDECTRKITVPMRREEMREELVYYLEWYNQHRPHEFIDDRTPNEAYYDQPAANETPRIEPRSNYPPDSPCAAPPAPIEGQPGQKVKLVVTYHAGRKHLPIITLKKVA